MIKLEDRNTIYFDVDHTLVMYDLPDDIMESKGIITYCHNHKELVVPHDEHIKMLKDCHNAKQVVVVWSQRGSDWCETVVDLLGLREYVDLCVTKPQWYVDDCMVTDFMPHSSRIYRPYARSSDPSN